jgi:hypothetical protein
MSMRVTSAPGLADYETIFHRFYAYVGDLSMESIASGDIRNFC